LVKGLVPGLDWHSDEEMGNPMDLATVRAMGMHLVMNLVMEKERLKG
jgi:hypothetical protein